MKSFPWVVRMCHRTFLKWSEEQDIYLLGVLTKSIVLLQEYTHPETAIYNQHTSSRIKPLRFSQNLIVRYLGISTFQNFALISQSQRLPHLWPQSVHSVVQFSASRPDLLSVALASRLMHSVGGFAIYTKRFRTSELRRWKQHWQLRRLLQSRQLRGKSTLKESNSLA
jgi:hypothetical protein